MVGSPTRRSSRARTTQSQSHHSSANSSASGRTERVTRGYNKAGSPHKSSSPDGSTLGTAGADDAALLRRRSARGKDEDRTVAAHGSKEIHDEDDAVRCVCGFDDWPGPPQFDDEIKKFALKEAIDLTPIYSITSITPDHDLAGLFVQCDTCGVWQHGLCVAIVTNESTPDEFYCESCRGDFHEVKADRNGQKYSIYLPIHRPKTSPAPSVVKDDTRSPKTSERKTSRSSTAAQSASSKRRSTMNSRDEEEQLRRAIQASMEDAIVEEPEAASRRPKRGRDDDEEHVDETKRQKTNSKSPSPRSDEAPRASHEESEEEANRNGGSKKSSRNAARSQREKAERDERREEQERKRVEAANKRKGRAERRRADDSDPSDEMPLAVRAVATRTTDSANPPDPPPSSQPVPDTPPADKAPVSSHKKRTGPHKKAKGRNQYTKDRDLQEKATSPARSMSRDIARHGEETGATHKPPSNEGVSKSHSRSKGGMSSKVTMTDMKRRANNILEFITRTQVELVSEPLSEKDSPQQATREDGTGTVPAIQINGNHGRKQPPLNGEIGNGLGAMLGEEFKEMSCIEMMDALARDLVKWQQEFAP